MSFNDEDEPLLKTWLERRLSKISDAEAPILAEYCIALLRHDQSEAEVRDLCVDQLGDFLKENTKPFVTDVFQAIKSRSFVGVNSKVGALSVTRPQERIPEHSKPTNTVKNHKLSTIEQRQPTSSDTMGFPEMPLPPQAMMADPSFMRYMQGLQGMQIASNLPRKRKHCFAFERDGVCPRGTACPYEHVTQVQRKFHEYDPSFSSMTGTSGALPKPRNERNGQRRSDLKMRGPQYDKSKSSLVIENIPAERLDETLIRSYFQGFGEILNIEVNRKDGMAVVKFKDWDTANAAYCSPAPVFDNRFVKIFWLQENSTQQSKRRARPRSTSLSSSTELDPSVVEAKQQAHEQRLARMSDMERRKAELKDQQDALQKKQQEQAAILLNLNGGQPAPENGSPNTPRAALQAQLDELKLKAAALGVTSEDFRTGTSTRGSRGRGAHLYRGGFRGRGKPSQYSGRPRSLDLRPKTLRITNNERPIQEIEAQVRQSSAYESIEVESQDTLKVAFKTRFEAEAFSSNSALGKMSWVSQDVSSSSQSANHQNDSVSGDSRMMDEDFDRYDD